MILYEDAFFIAISFFISILVTRVAVTFIWKVDISSLKERRVADLPIHHFSYGLLLVAIAGYIALATSVDHWTIPCLFGAGLGLIVDEFYTVHFILGRFWMKADPKGNLYWNRAAYLIAITVGVLLVILALIAQRNN